MANYGALTSGADNDFGELRRYINRQLLEKDVTIKTALRATAFLNDLNEKSVKKSGLDFELPVRRELSSTVKNFIPGGDTNDFIGTTDPASSTTDTYTRKDPIRNMRANFSFSVDDLRIDTIYLSMIDSPGKLIDYLDERIDYMSDTIIQHVADQIINGTGNGALGTLPGVTGSANQNWYGLQYQERRFSGTATGATALTLATGDVTDNTHFGLLRHDHPSLICNVLDATQVEDDVTPSTSIVTRTDAGVADGGTLWGNWTEADTTDLSGLIGYDMYYRATGSSDAWVRAGVVADASSSTTANSAIRLDRSNTFATADAGSAGTGYDLEFRPPFLQSTEGASGVFNINKLHKAYLRAADGSEMPDYARCSASTFYGFMQHLQQLQRWWRGEDADLAAKGYMNFMFNAAKVVVDNHEADGTITFCNTKYNKLYFQKQYSDFAMRRTDLIPSLDGRAVASKVGAVIVGGQVVCSAPNRTAKIINLTV